MQAEQELRQGVVEPTMDLVRGFQRTAGATPQERIDWLLLLDPDQFKEFFVKLNATVRGIDPDNHDFDGERVIAGPLNDIPAEHEDKLKLIDTLLCKTQDVIQRRLRDQIPTQEILNEIAVVMPVVLNQIHGFEDGNGRSTRVLRALLRDGDSLTKEVITPALDRKVSPLNCYDSSPSGHTSVLKKLYAKFLSKQIKPAVSLAKDSLFDLIKTPDWDPEFDFDVSMAGPVKKHFDKLDPSIIDCIKDNKNLRIVVGNFIASTAHNPEDLLDLCRILNTDQKQQDIFKSIYAKVRVERVEFMIDTLYGLDPLTIGEDLHSSLRSYQEIRDKEDKVIFVQYDGTYASYQRILCETYSPQQNPWDIVK